MRKGTWASVVLAGLAWMGVAGAAHAASGSAQAKAIMARLPFAFEPSADGRTYLSHTGSSWTRVSPTGFQVEEGRSQDAAIGMELVGTAGQGAMTAEEPAGEANYLLGADMSHWRRHVPEYGRVVSRNVYRGIDLVFHGSEGRLEHDFVVAPQADYRAIRMRYTAQASLTTDGELRIERDAGLMIVHAPVAYQEISGRQVTRESHFVLAKGEVSFAVGDYDRSRPLVIDPVLDYGTYLADQDLHVAAMAVDSAGNTYITGLSFLDSYPVTAGAVQTTCASCPNKPDVFVTKLNAAGTAQVYSTFLGGNDYDESLAITVDGQGNAIVAGRTGSSDFPVKNPLDSGRPTLFAGFATSLTPDGSGLNFSTILAGADAAGHGGNTYIKAVATDSNGNAYVGGLSDATTVPLTPGALDAVAPGYPTQFYFMTKLSRTGALLYGAILGQVDPTSECCSLDKITVNPQGELLIAGTIGSDYNTGAVHWPTTPGAYQTAALAPSGASPIVAKLAADGSHFLFSTLAGAGVVRDAVVDATGATLLLGDTFSPVPVTADAYLSQSAGGFLEKISADGTRLLYASYLGDPSSTGFSTLTTSNIALDSSGNVWVEGQVSGSFPVVHPLQSLLPGGPSQTGFLSEFDPAMHTLLFSTYFAGNLGGFQPAGLAFDSVGKLHLAGAGPFDMPTTSGALRETVTPPPPDYSYSFGYVGLIDPAAANPGLCVKEPVPLTAELGSSTQASIPLTNCGLAPLTISGTQISGLGLNLPTPTACDTTIAPGDTCTLPLSFTPQITLQTAAVLTIDSNAMVKESIVPFDAIGICHVRPSTDRAAAIGGLPIAT